MPNDFFERPQAAAQLKHELLKRYLRVFVQKLGSTSQGKRVAFLDGYAGPGTYGDQSPGSPALALDVAKAVAGVDDLLGFLVEADKANHDHLKVLVEANRPDWHVYQGDVEKHLDDILGKAGSLPLFVFLNPFGLGLPLSTLTSKLLSRSKKASVGVRPRAATEVLLNFSLSGLRRTAGHLDSTSDYPIYQQQTRSTFLDKMDATLGGLWWREVWQNHPSGAREDAILNGYVARLQSAGGGWIVTTVPVADRWQRSPIYHLIHLTQHPDGAWLFNESLSSALEVYRVYCIDSEGQLDLETSEHREQLWIEHIGGNIERLLAQGSFVVEDRASEVLGDASGWARSKHIRAAVKALHAKGATPTDGKGDIRTMRIETVPPSGVAPR